MTFRDEDDYQEEDENLDEEEESYDEDETGDDEDEQLGRRSSTSPFSSLGRSDTGQQRSSYSGGYGSSSSRLPGSPGSSGTNSPRPFNSGSSPTPPGGSRPSYVSGGSSGSPSSPSSPSRPSYTSGGSSGSSASSPPSRPSYTSGGGGSSSGSTGGTGPLGGGSSRPFSSGSGGSSSGSGSGSPYSPSGGGSSSSGSSGGSSSAGSPASRSPFSSGSGSSPSSPSSSSSSSSAPAKPAADEKKDDKPAAPKEGGSNPLSGVGSRLGGLTGGLSSRLGGDKKDEKKDDKPAAPKEGGGSNPLSGVGSRLGGLTGGLTSRLGGGDKKDEKKDDKPAAPKEGGSSNPLSSVGNRLGGLTGGLTSRFGSGDKKDEKKDDKPAAPKSAAPAASSSSPSAPAAATPSRPTFGQAKPAAAPGAAPAAATPVAAKAAAAAKPAGSLADRLRASLPFGKKDDKPAPKKTTVREKAERASKAPKVDQAGVSLDTKLDILSVGLLLGSVALFLSSVSTTKGQVTEAVNTFLSQLLGWGAIAVPAMMAAVGLWLIWRHFGDQAPVINSSRLVGAGVLYVGLLIAFQYIDSVRSMYTLAVLEDFLNASVEAGRGGGRLGAELYSFLVLNITELGGMCVVIGTLVIGLMLLLRISAAEIAIFAISIGRSFADARRRRVQDRQAAARLAAQQAAAAAALAAPQISVTKPALAELPNGKPTPALPAASAETPPIAIPIPEPRPIPITMGGKTVTAFFDAAETESVPVETKPAATPAASVAPAPLPTPAKPGGGLFGGRVPLPGRKPDAAPAASADAEKKSGGVLGNMFNRTAAQAQPPAASAPTPAAPVTPEVKPATPAASAPDTRFAPPAAPVVNTPLPKPEDAPMRLGDLVKPAAEPTPPAATPFDTHIRPFAVSTPVAASTKPDEDDDEDEELAKMEPAKPKGTGPLPRPDTSPFGRPAATNGDGVVGRMSRLDQLRAGQIRPGVAPAAVNDDKPAAPVTPAATTEEKPAAPTVVTPAASAATPLTPAATSPTPPAASPLTPAPFAATPARQSAYPSDEVKPRDAVSFTSAQTANGTASPAFHRPETPPGVPIATHAPTIVSSKPRRVWKLPNAQTLLNAGSESDFDRETLLERARIIEETLSSFGAPGRVVEVNTGPVITQFGVEPDYLVARSGKKSRVKVGAIAQLDKDLQLALGAKSIRIEAPVPGKGFVGIEVPNEEAATVSLRDVMESDEFKKIRAKSPLAIALGQSVDGTPVVADLASMPHLLIAGTTGSGKSVQVNSIICGLIVSNAPDRVKFVMVDPKRVELTGYNGIPHLLAPVVVELERIVGVLKWVTREMDERYKKFSSAGARNIEDYNKHLGESAEQMPYIVVIIDELADLMMLAPDETERVITRIAALARATGIHLVIATQRPSVDVVTGLIKANFPARIAFAVAGGVDSRVILDQPGAERLLGRGDMLYLSGDSPAALRLQGVYVSDTEINNITRYWKMLAPEEEAVKPISALVLDDSAKEESRDVMPRTAPSFPAAPAKPAAPQAAFWDDDGGDDGGDDDEELPDGQDELYEQSVELVRRLNKASVSLLQRRLRIGYTRAARLIDMMEEQGIVGPAQEGSKPREVLTSPLKD